MKKVFFSLFLLCFLIGCKQHKLIAKETVKTYYESFEAGDYTSIKSVISDSITLIAGDYVMPYDQGCFYEHFKWDSVFKTTYQLLVLEEKNNHVFATVASKSIKNKFLKNNPLTCTFKISFKSGKISTIEDFEYRGTNWRQWASQRDTLVRWISKTHPTLDGFVNDMSMKGAMDYVKAIKLYQNHQKAKK